MIGLLLLLLGCARSTPTDAAQVACRPGGGEVLAPRFDGADAERPRQEVRLVPVALGCGQVTDIQPVPGQPDRIVVLSKQGDAWWVDLAAGTSGRLLDVDVLTASEQGLLGLAFHPDFRENGRFFVHLSVRSGGRPVGRIAEWGFPAGKGPGEADPVEKKVVLDVEQPYANHDGGQLQFGPDGHLYVAYGDGGAANDPQGNGQDLSTLLGTILRLDVDGGDPYGIPKDNPFVGRKGARPEIWAYGLRNPWRFAFAPDGRLVAADVGQNLWEEVDLVPPGGNMGWAIREGRHCFQAENCRTEGLVDPIWEYGRDEGRSVTGGYVVGDALPALAGKYVLADYATGRFWALPLPDAPGQLVEATALGRFEIQPATFGLDGRGRLYVGDLAGGTVYRVVVP